MNTTSIGRAYEERARRYLKSKGLRILVQNFRTRFTEIDLIAEEETSLGLDLVFVEVRFRAHGGWVDSLSSVTLQKQNLMRAGATTYLQKYAGLAEGLRFDILAFDGREVQWIRNAF